MKKNGKIELLRFLFSIGVLCVHIQKYLPGEVSVKNGVRLSFFPYGAIGVEFFFILSGFLMAATLFHSGERRNDGALGENTIGFVVNKFMSLLPMRLIVFVLMFLSVLVCEAWDGTTIIKKLLFNIPGLFLVQMSGIGEMYVNHVEWYLSVMLIGMLVIYPFLRKYFDVFSKIVAPLVVIFGLGYMYQSYGRLTGVVAWDGVCYRSMLRGIVELCFGIVAFTVCEKIKDIKLNAVQKTAVTCFELLCWGVVFTMMMLTMPRNYEFYMLFFIAVGVICTFSNLSFGGSLFQNKVCFYLGKLSLPIYLCQLVPITLVPKYLNFLPMKQQMLITFVGAIVLAVGVFSLSNLVSSSGKDKGVR